MFSLKFCIIHWIVVIIHEITSKEGIVFYSLWKLSVELVFELKCKLSRLLLCLVAVFFMIFNFYVDLLLLRHVAVFFMIFNFYVDLLQKISLSMMPVVPLIAAG